MQNVSIIYCVNSCVIFFCVYLDICNRDFDVWFCCMSLASVGLRPNVSSPNLHCTLIGRHTTARRRWTPHPLPMPAPITFLSLLPWRGPNLSFVTLPLYLTTKARRIPRRSCIFRSCIFMPCDLVLHFQVLHFPGLHFQRPQCYAMFYCNEMKLLQRRNILL